MTVHDFNASLDLSARHVDSPWWEEAYRAAFPTLDSMTCVRSDGWAQRGGIDRVLTLSSGKTIAVDEKVRDRDWPDFALEYWSDAKNQTKGWAIADLACDYIAYAFIPSGRCYLLPFQQLRKAMLDNGREWVAAYRDPAIHLARNRRGSRSWETHFVPVPIDVVLDALTDAMLVSFTARAEAAA